jgi:hypothetical protein
MALSPIARAPRERRRDQGLRWRQAFSSLGHCFPYPADYAGRDASPSPSRSPAAGSRRGACRDAAEKAGFAPRLDHHNARAPPIRAVRVAIAGSRSRARSMRARPPASAASCVTSRQQAADLGHSPGARSGRPMSSPACCAAGRPSGGSDAPSQSGCAGGTEGRRGLPQGQDGRRGEVEATLTTRNAMCNSACGYLFLGATTREVRPMPRSPCIIPS